jgi:hypothetical protein
MVKFNLRRPIVRFRRKPPPMPTREEMAEGWTPPVIVEPWIVHLAAELEGMSPERRATLQASESPNGWPARWARFYERPGGWPAFKAMCEEALINFHEYGRPITHSLIVCEEDREAHGFAGSTKGTVK